MCENYEISLRTRTLSNCTCRECGEYRDWHRLKQESAQKAFQEQLHRVKTALMKKRVFEYLKEGHEDSSYCKFSELCVKHEENVSYRLVTISLDTSELFLPEDKGYVNADRLVEMIDSSNARLRKLKFIPRGARWVFEQRGETVESIGQGLHIHIMFPVSKKPPNEIVRDIARPFKLKENFVHVATIPFHAANKYLTGDKQISKMKKQEMDKIMRKENNIENIYVK